MLVTFTSSQTGELMMFADVARQLLTAAGKHCTARGAFAVDEMQDAAAALRRAVERGEAPPDQSGKDDEGVEIPVTLSSRAWPFIDMLERTAQGGKKANIVWQAAADF